MSGAVQEAWLDRAGNAFYILDGDETGCATDFDQSYVVDPGAPLACRKGQHLAVVGRLEPVKYDFTGSGLFIHASSLRCF